MNPVETSPPQDLSLPFDIAGGSVTGRNHQHVGKNNQDALGWWVTERAIVAVVCDGCGSSPHSEVGAHLGVQFLLKALGDRLPSESPDLLMDPAFWETLRETLLQQLTTLAQNFPGSWVTIFQNYFLFTIIGCVITPEITVIFSLGDSIALVNNHRLPTPTFSHNAPPYLAYSLLSTSFTATELQFQLLQVLPTAELESLVIASDGLQDLMDAEFKTLPGQQKVVGSVAQFWQDDRYFKNPDQIRRQLSLLNREVTIPHWSAQQIQKISGLLPDDTSLVSIRRRLAP
jgi:serine/threonine protein phosphatase PrpC